MLRRTTTGPSAARKETNAAGIRIFQPERARLAQRRTCTSACDEAIATAVLRFDSMQRAARASNAAALIMSISIGAAGEFRGRRCAEQAAKHGSKAATRFVRSSWPRAVNRWATI